MNILVRAKNMKTTKALRDFVNRQFSKLKRLGLPIQKVQVFLENIERKDSDPHRASVQVTADVAKKGRITVESKAHDLYLAVGEATKSLMRHLRKEKEKRTDVARRLTRKFKRNNHQLD